MRRTPLAYAGLTMAIFVTLGCFSYGLKAQSVFAPLNHLYDYQLLHASSQKVISLSQLAQDLESCDVVFFGEIHGHRASHYLQLQILAALSQNNAQLILSMEQFSRDNQGVLDQYLAGEIGEEALIHHGDAWPNYPSDYRPLVEFAKARQLAVIAANAPRKLVRRIALEGPEMVHDLPKRQRAYLAKELTTSSVAYQQKFRHFLAQSPEFHRAGKKSSNDDGLGNIFYAQLAWDNTMAESIAKALEAKPDHQVMAINGAFHSDDKLGTVEALRQLKPHLKIRVISPLIATAEADDMSVLAARGDYIYRVQSLPTRNVQNTSENDAKMRGRQHAKCDQCAW